MDTHLRPRRTLRTMFGGLVSLLLAFGTAIGVTLGAEPGGWRGDGSGRFPDGQPPTTWSKESGIAWKAELPGGGYASPVLSNGRLFVAAEPASLVCLSAADGKVLWRAQAGYLEVLGERMAAEIEATHARLDKEQREARERYDALSKAEPKAAELPESKSHVEAIDREKKEYCQRYPNERRGDGGNATATPVCDGEHVFVTFGTGIVAAFDVEDGETLWACQVDVSQVDWGHTASPVIAGGKLVVHFQDLIALDRQSGEELWRSKVPAKHGTPAVAKVGKEVGEEDVIVTPSGALVRARDGHLLAEKLFDLPDNSPLVHDGVIYVHEGGKVKALRLPSSLDEPIDNTPVWETKCSGDQRMASAVWHDGLLYSGTRRGVLDVTDASTGEIVYRQRLEVGDLIPSLAVAGELIFVSGAEGKTLILRPGREFDEVAVNHLERFCTSPLFAGQSAYIRADKCVYCVGP